jgi:hypothetical protein
METRMLTASPHALSIARRARTVPLATGLNTGRPTIEDAICRPFGLRAVLGAIGTGGRTTARTFFLLASALALSGAAVGCGEPAPGTVEVAVYGEAFIEEGIPAEEFSDGWAVTFDSFLVTLSEVTVTAGHGAPALSAPAQRVFDLSKATLGKGTPVVSKTIDGGDYDHVTYQIGPARSGAAAGNTLAAGALEGMVTAGESVRVSGSATKAGKTVRFAWGFPRRTDHACHVGLKVDGGSARAEITIHGDHLFYDDLLSKEPDLAFDLIAASDTDADGAVTQAELTAQDIRGQSRYQVGNIPATTLWSFIAHQATTLGHIDGEGHCDTTTD